MHRREFLTRSALGGAGLALGPGLWQAVFAQPATPASGPYGSLDRVEPDANGLLLPDGFSSRVIAVSGDSVADTGYEWHVFPDGGATYATDDGGWIYVSNSEAFVPGEGGASAVRFDADGGIVDAYRILGGTTLNCAGGPTPWGTWLSCEEFDVHDAPDQAALLPTIAGQVWETDPTGAAVAVAVPVLGLFQHEAVAVDPDLGLLYLTEDQPDGRLYRFTPDAYPTIDAGSLEVAALDGGTVEWLPLPDPTGEQVPTRLQVAASTPFDGGEGVWFHQGVVFFTTKGDNRIHALETATDSYEVIYDAEAIGETAPLRGVDNLTVEEGSGDLYVAEDGGSMQVVLITPEREVAPFLRVLDQDGSEITGPAFDPDGSRLYFSSQRGNDLRGITYEVTGPFRGPQLAASGSGGSTTVPAVPTTLASGTEAAAGAPADDSGGDRGAAPFIVGGLVAGAAIAGGAAVAVRRRNRAAAADAGAEDG